MLFNTRFLTLSHFIRNFALQLMRKQEDEKRVNKPTTITTTQKQNYYDSLQKVS